MLFGKPTKHIRGAFEATHVIEPQRFTMHKFWSFDNAAASRTDGQDITGSLGLICPKGSRITSHKMEILVTPETIEPQQIYMGRVKLSFHDVLAHPVCGGRFNQASLLDTTTMDFEVKSGGVNLGLWSDDAVTTDYVVRGSDTVNLEIGGSGSGDGILEMKLDDNIAHFLNLKKLTVFDQRPLMGDRRQRIPSKVKRINEGTYYGLFIFNDSPRGGTAADTQITVNIKDEYTEMAI